MKLKVMPGTLALGALLLITATTASKATSQPAPDPALYEIDSVQEIQPMLYRVTTPAGDLIVRAAPASDLAGLQNLDALSEDWVCRFLLDPVSKVYTPKDCSVVW